MAKKKSPRIARPAAAPDEVAAAYQRTEKDIEALPKERVGRVNADVPTAVSLALGALPALESLRGELQAALKHPPLAEIARLHDRALAALYAHLHHAPKITVSEADLEEARVQRERLLASADAHVAHGQLDADAIAAVREGQGHLDRANDLIALAALFRGVWSELEGHTQVTDAQLDRATVLGTTLVAALGAKELGTGPATGGASWSDRRNRAFRLLMNDYDEIRWAVEYVRRHEGDAASYAPPLYLNQRSRPRKPDETDAQREEGGSLVGNG
ncbi:hypothetical protein [Sandaracinus amylolyticus]|uniref:Uncharacterized protein n=1 Tax=Sandaracinus amylolyticus TaxID=927083 RepID=A0A0F6W882_9BACT|nr:hypothetical protein [Sandaracinus amylolyticus]AKF09802.1 hypothetical protein DB32_006951 [Sandaracinus amylolyticus]